jgi:hypothetical protein
MILLPRLILAFVPVRSPNSRPHRTGIPSQPLFSPSSHRDRRYRNDHELPAEKWRDGEIFHEIGSLRSSLLQRFGSWMPLWRYFKVFANNKSIFGNCNE